MSYVVYIIQLKFATILLLHMYIKVAAWINYVYSKRESFTGLERKKERKFHCSFIEKQESFSYKFFALSIYVYVVWKHPGLVLQSIPAEIYIM